MTTLKSDLKFFEHVYPVYKFLYWRNASMRTERIQSESEFIRSMISGWPRERAIAIYKHLYLTDLLAQRELARSEAEAPKHVFEFECFSCPPDLLIDPSASMEIADFVAEIDIAEPSPAVAGIASLTNGVSGADIIAAIESARPSGEPIVLTSEEWMPAIDSVFPNKAKPEK